MSFWEIRRNPSGTTSHVSGPRTSASQGNTPSTPTLVFLASVSEMWVQDDKTVPPGSPCPDLRVGRTHPASEGLSAAGCGAAKASSSQLSSSSSYCKGKDLESAGEGLAAAAEPGPLPGPPTAAPAQPLTARAFREQPAKAPHCRGPRWAYGRPEGPPVLRERRMRIPGHSKRGNALRGQCTERRACLG